MKNNIKIIRKAHKETGEQLAKALGVSQPTISLWENGEIDYVVAQRVANHYKTTPEYILGTHCEVSKNKQDDDNNIKIEMLDATACCGVGIDNFQENVIGLWSMPINDFKSISLSSTPENVKMLRVKGDSMSPTVRDGDWVLVDISYLSPDSDGMFLLYLSTGLAIKRVQGTISDEIVIKSDNPKYDNFNAKLTDVKILGKVIYTLKAEKVG
ncbi:MAG: LexA family transcriptional regulator [Alphaproteobacteria bacterium]|nr:LexA family transcriptional regulator [Alphaproteobacteria bacterium]